MTKKRIGFALTGSFCTWARVIPILEELSSTYDLFPILSPIAYISDNRFGKAADWRAQIEEICGRPVWHTIEQVEPVGPKNLLDALVIAPCTGNTLGKLAGGITDTAPVMANDALGASARNIGQLMNARNVYFVPMAQDDPNGKPASVVAHFERINETLSEAFKGRQLQPVYS